jgi:spore coat polysaccharide biosynthesis predicted glycosyltransferase SpsG/RimJ/RimL family protein N-acetyltransferase
VDSSSSIGSGHVYRCIAIAEEAKKLGIAVRFLYADFPGSSTGDILNGAYEIFPIKILQFPHPSSEDVGLVWDLDTQLTDSRFVIESFSEAFSEFILVDHYGLGDSWGKAVSEHILFERILFLVDDPFYTSEFRSMKLSYPTPEHLDDAILSATHNEGIDYFGSHIPMSDSIRNTRVRSASKPRSVHAGLAKNVLVFLGNSNVSIHLDKILSSISQLDTRDKINLSVIRGHGVVPAEQVSSQYNNVNWVTFSNQSDYLDFMMKQDLVIGAGGVACIERLFLGVPQIVFSIAKNQIPNCEALSAWGALKWGGNLPKLSAEDTSIAISKALYATPELTEKWDNGMLFSDGYGARRVLQTLLKLPLNALQLRPLEGKDSSTLFLWANEVGSRRNSISKARIAPNTHKKWVERLLSTRADKSILYILEDQFGPLGQVRFDEVDTGEYQISYGLDSAFRGQGLGKIMISMGLEAHRRVKPGSKYKALALSNNFASTLILESLGFSLFSKKKDQVEYQLDLHTGTS